MKFKVAINNCDDSNLFLRALSGKFETKLGKCAWNYTPFKARKETRIFLGFMDINLHTVFQVYIHYKHRGCVDILEIKNKDGDEVEDKFQQIIKDVVEDTLKSYKEGEIKLYRFNIESFRALSNYNSEKFTIIPISDTIASISCCVECYGENDGIYMLIIKKQRFLDLLSVLTNLPFYNSQLKGIMEKKREELYYSDDNYIDDYPCDEQYVLLPRFGKYILEKVMTYNKEIDDENIIKLVNAAKHFHAGRKFDAQINDLLKLELINSSEIAVKKRDLINATGVCDCIFEMTVVSYISALEVLASILYPNEGEECDYCGQVKYSISARVKKLLFRYFDENLAKIIHGFYSSRSKFLHLGKPLKNVYTGMTIPQLDKKIVSQA